MRIRTGRVKQWPTLRRASRPLLPHATINDTADHFCPNRPDLSNVLDALLWAIHKNAVVDSVKELFRINIHHNLAYGMNISLHGFCRVVRATARSKAIPNVKHW